MPQRASELGDYPIWHPFTQMKTAGLPLEVERAKDEFLFLADGRKIIDCISSWWVTLHGHANERIAQAIHDQACRLEHVIFAGFTHAPAQQLSESLLEELPRTLSKVFFSDNGSTSVEVALKMAFQYWRNIGQVKRTRFIGFEGGYHGDTLGAMSAGGSSSFWKPFRELMFAIDVAPYPHTWDGDPDVAEKEELALAAVRDRLDKGDKSHAAIIIEPLVQGAAGMRMCTPRFLQRLEKLSKDYDTLLIFDEVMTGFGRTGDMFACTKSGATPDIICLSKGITGGCLPLSVTIATDRIYDAFLSDNLEQALFHSHSYTGNPIACAAANASLALLRENRSQFAAFESRHRAFAQRHLSAAVPLEKARFCGTIAAFDLMVENCDYYSSTPAELRRAFLERGLLMRPLGTTIYLLPPLCMSDESLDAAYGAIAELAAKRVVQQAGMV